MAKKDKKVRIFSALEVANICGVVNQTAINWIKNNHLKAFTTPGGQYRIYAEDLLEFLQNRGMRIPEELEELVENSDERAILVVDDNKELNQMLKDFLSIKMSGYTIHQAFDGFEAGSKLSRFKPKAVVLDIDLPGINGFSLCQRIKEDSALKNPKIISISGMNMPGIEERIRDHGADAFFPKPVNLEDIADKLLEMVE